MRPPHGGNYVQASEDAHGPPGSEDRVPDSETTMVPVILGYSDSPSSLRLRLRFDDRELIVDERALSITIGRAEENDVVLRGHLSSRLHARIVLGRSNFGPSYGPPTDKTYSYTGTFWSSGALA